MEEIKKKRGRPRKINAELEIKVQDIKHAAKQLLEQEFNESATQEKSTILKDKILGDLGEELTESISSENQPKIELKQSFIPAESDIKANKSKKCIKIIRNFKVSYRSGWLTKDDIYRVEDIEGEMDTAEKLVKSKYACFVEGDNLRVQGKPMPFNMKKLSEDESKMTLEDIRKMARERTSVNA